MLWENLTSNEFSEAVKKAKGVCAVPIGCIEKHGPHAPLGTDTIISGGITALAAEKEPVVVFPTMYFGEKTGAGEFPGTLIFSAETRWKIFKETCTEIYRNGFKKIVFCDGHGGNVSMMNFFTRAMMQELPDVMTFYCNTNTDKIFDNLIHGDFPYLTEDDRKSLQDFVDKCGIVGHACLTETGRVYHLRPETINMELVETESGESTHRFDEFGKRGISTNLAWMANYPNSYSATNQYVMNERIAKALVEDRVDYVASVFKFLKEETVSNEYHAEWIQKQGF